MIQLSATMDSIECPIVKSDSTCYWKDMWQKLDRMRQLWQLCDVSLVTADNRMFMAHSPVLAASSNILHDILIRQNQTGAGEETQKNVLLKNVTSEVLDVTLNFIYGITPLTRLAFERLQVGAKDLGIKGAYEYCCHQLKKLGVEASGTKGEDNSLPASVRFSSREENLISYRWQMDQPSSLNDAKGQKCEFAGTASQSAYQVSQTRMGLDAAHGMTSTVGWPLNGYELVADGKASVDKHVDKVGCHSVSSSASDADNSQPDILDGMPSDDIHAAMFTQVSLMDLTAGVKCPHIKGIMGEDNLMDSFLVENELVDETYKTSLTADESDFDETPTLEEHSIDFAVPVPPKKSKRSPAKVSGNDRGTEPTDQSSIPEKSSEDHNVVEDSNFETIPKRNTSASSKDTSNDNALNCNFNLLSCFASSDSLNPCSSSGSIQAALQRNFTETLPLISLDEEIISKPQNMPTNDIDFVQLVSDSEKLQIESPSLQHKSVPGCRSFLHACTSSASQCCQDPNAQTDSSRSIFSDDDLPPSHFSFNNKGSLHSAGLVSGLSGNLLMSQSPISSRPFINVNLAREAYSSFESVGSHQVCSSVWGNEFASLKMCTAPSNMLTAAKKFTWETASILEPICSKAPKANEDLGSNLDSASGLDIALKCEQKVFASLESIFPTYVTNRPALAVSSAVNIGSAISMDNGQSLCFSTLEPSQGIAPNTLTRSQPTEICPSVADTSVSVSTFHSSDEIFLRESLHAVTTNRIQEDYLSSSPELKGDSDQIKSGKCQCNHCNKVFKNISQLNGHRKRVHLPTSMERSSTNDKSTSLHQCQYCQESFKSSYKLQTHQLKVHSKGKLFSCQDCSFRSPRKKDVQAHMLSQHGRAPYGVKVYSCSSCNYKCIDRNRFEEHEAKHTGITSHRCPLCSRAYTTKRGMRTHIKYHSEERPHKCNICGAAFKVTSKLSDHMKLIHIQKGVKPYKCGYCDHATALRGNCNQHIRKNHPGQPLFVVDKFASQRKCVKDYDYAGMAGDGIEENRDLKAAKAGIQSRKMAVL